MHVPWPVPENVALENILCKNVTTHYKFGPILVEKGYVQIDQKWSRDNTLRHETIFGLFAHTLY